MDSEFIRSLELMAKRSRARIGIGIWKADPELILSLKLANEFADLILVGDSSMESSLDYIKTDEPWAAICKLLAEGEIDGAVRGNLPASKTMKALASQFGMRIMRLALIELPGWAFFMGPVGIDEGETISDKLAMVMKGANYLQNIGISSKVSVLSGGRREDIGRSAWVDKSLAEGEFIAAQAREEGVIARHRGILIEECRGDDLIIAPDGISGNLIFRSLMLLCNANAMGAPVLMDKIFVDSSRARGNFTGPIILASAMAGMK
ncbi:MAG: methanogenesis marker protein Mmp4/MtxX [Methanotrichaceae archaeon]|nr:methanogenesis marker protein Mmp4/MtxX [Methanotrichaceae archaeon]